MGDPLSAQRERYRKSLARSFRNLVQHLAADPEVEQIIPKEGRFSVPPILSLVVYGQALSCRISSGGPVNR